MFKKILDWCQGRHTFFAGVELAVGTTLAWFHRLDMNFVALCGTIQSLVLMHSVKEDWFTAKGVQPSSQALIPQKNQDIPPNGQNS
jgi:hypothetical protein